MKKFLFLIIICAFVFSGCSRSEPYEPPPSEEPAPTEEPVSEPVEPVASEGGSLRLSMRLPKTLNPLLNQDASVDEFLRLVYEPLVLYDESLRPAINPALVDYAACSPDGISLVLCLRDGLFWDGGAPINANDIIYSLNILKTAPETAVYKSRANMIESYERVSELSVKITFSEPHQELLYWLMFPIIPSGASEGDMFIKRSESELPKGNGIYKFFAYTPAVELVLTPNETSLRDGPYISELRVQFTRDNETDIMSFKRNILDAVLCGIGDWSLALGEGGSRAYAFPSTYYDFVCFNFNNPLLRQKEVRRAIALSMPIDAAISDIYLGRADRAEAMIRPESYLYCAQEPPLERSIDKANNLLYSSGFSGIDVYGKTLTLPDGTRERAELRFTILYNAENDIREKIAGELKENLEKIGFSIELRGESFEDYRALIEARDYDIFIGGERLSDLKPDLSFMFASENAGEGKNYGDYRDELMDALLADVKAAANEDEYKETYAALQRYIAEELPVIGIAFREEALLTNGDLYGCDGVNRNGLYYNINEWFIFTP